jgi:hypothetical protein
MHVVVVPSSFKGKILWTCIFFQEVKFY